MSSKATLPYDQYMIDIVEYFHKPISFPGHARYRAQLAILDSLGCAIETSVQSAECRALLGPVVAGTVVPNGCRLPGTAFQLDPLKAAFDLGAMIRYMDHNDGYTGWEWGHPSDMLGAILAVADWQTRCNRAGTSNDTSSKGSAVEQSLIRDEPTSQPSAGSAITMKQIVEVTIKAYEVHCLFQQANSFNARGLDHTILVKIGAVVAVCWLLGMNPEQTLAALSQVYQDGGMLRTYRQGSNTSPRKGWAAGDACMRAVHLALLTQKGQPGAPTVLTDPKWGFYKTLFGGNPFEVPRPYGSHAIETSVFKLVAAEGHGISACIASSKIAHVLKSRGRTPDEIKKIAIRTMKPALTIINKIGALRNAADRDHCLSYMVAVSILKGEFPRVQDYADDSPFANDPLVEQLRSVTEVYEDTTLTQDYYDPEKRTLAAGLAVTLDEGECLDEVLIEAPLGHPKHPDTCEAVLTKFQGQMALAFDTDSIDRIKDAVFDDDLPVSVLMDMLWKGPRADEAANPN